MQVCLRPDIAFVVKELVIYLNGPTEGGMEYEEEDTGGSSSF